MLFTTAGCHPPLHSPHPRFIHIPFRWDESVEVRWRWRYLVHCSFPPIEPDVDGVELLCKRGSVWAPNQICSLFSAHHDDESAMPLSYFLWRSLFFHLVLIANMKLLVSVSRFSSLTLFLLIFQGYDRVLNVILNFRCSPECSRVKAIRPTKNAKPFFFKSSEEMSGSGLTLAGPTRKTEKYIYHTAHGLCLLSELWKYTFLKAEWHLWRFCKQDFYHGVPPEQYYVYLWLEKKMPEII